MKRPLAAAGFSCFAALILASYLPSAAALPAGIVCAAAGFVLLVLLHAGARRTISAVVLLGAAAAFIFYFSVYFCSYAPAARLACGRVCTVSGVVCEEPVKTASGFGYIVDADSILCSGKAAGIKCRVMVWSNERLGAEPFDRIQFTSALDLPDSGEKYGFDSVRYYRSKGIYLSAFMPENIKTHSAAEKPPYYYAIMLRRHISATLARYMPGERGALAAGILIGDTSGIPQEVTNDFRTDGISHILAVSGTQTSLIAEYLMLLLCALRVRKRPAAAVCAAAVAGYMAVTGFSPSVMRAGIMSIIFLAGIVIGRDSDALNSLGFSVLALCAVNPFAACDAGLQLSFTAALGMITVSSRLIGRFSSFTQALAPRVRTLLRAPADILFETAGATIFTFPVIALTFGRFSLVTLPANLLEVPVSLIVTLAGAVIAVTGNFAFLDLFTQPVAMLSRLCCAFMIWFSHLLARIPFADISVAYPFVWVTLVFAAVMCAVYFVFRGRGARAWICAVCVAAVALCGAAGQVMSQRGSVTLAVLSPGGSCCGSTVVCCGGHAAVFDLGGGGADKQDAQYIRAHNITAVDALILPVYDKNRVKLANSLLGDVKIKNIYIPGAYRSDENAMAKCVTGEGRMPLGGAELALLPSSDGRSLMAQLRYGNFSAVLTGPAKADTSDYGIASRPRGNIPVIFSGSMSQAFAMTFRPPDAVESGGAGAADAGAELRRLGSRIFDTRTLGNVTIRARSDGSYAIQS